MCRRLVDYVHEQYIAAAMAARVCHMIHAAISLTNVTEEERERKLGVYYHDKET